VATHTLFFLVFCMYIKKIVFVLVVLCGMKSTFASEDSETETFLQKRNRVSHERVRLGAKYFGATCTGFNVVSRTYLLSDVLLGRPRYLNNASRTWRGWRCARNFDLQWMGVPGTMPVDFSIGRMHSSFSSCLLDVLTRIGVGYPVMAAMLLGHECGHSLTRYLLTGVGSTIYVGASWRDALGLKGEGASISKPLLSLFCGRLVFRGCCFNSGVSCPDRETERDYPTIKGLAISMAGGIAGIATVESLKVISYLFWRRHKEPVSERKVEKGEYKPTEKLTIKKLVQECCSLDSGIVYNLFNMLYPVYGLDAYYLWWFIAYHTQAKEKTEADLKIKETLGAEVPGNQILLK